MLGALNPNKSFDTADEKFVYYMTYDGIDYALTEGFNEETLKKINHDELRAACFKAREALLELDVILDRDFSECFA